MLRRLIGLRNWLPEGERSGLDAVIQAYRRKEVACAPLPAATILAVAASGIDGAGAQSVFVLVKGRKHAVASLLVKFDAGIPDAWVQDGLTKREADSFLMRIEHEIEVFNASAPHLAAVLAHFLAVGLEAGKAPPFGLLDFVETAGLSAVNPGRISVDGLIDSLLEAIPSARRRPASVKQGGQGQYPVERALYLHRPLVRGRRGRQPGSVSQEAHKRRQTDGPAAGRNPRHGPLRLGLRRGMEASELRSVGLAAQGRS